MTGCSTDTPPIDAACADPAYRLAHPDECANFTVLILQPEYSLTEPGKTVSYTVILRANGREITLTTGLAWSSSNVGAAVINDDGVATGVLAGTTTIKVEWQNLSATAQLEVVGACVETNQHFTILIDDSASMGQAFSGTYGTKLAFSKSVARDFCQTINYSKDNVSAWKFADDSTRLIDFGVDANAARAAIQTVAVSAEKTNLADALEDVIAGFPATGVRVIVLFTDGEWTGDSPLAVGQAFKESGGFLVVVVTRGWGDFFADMANLASGGFFLSAYGATEGNILASLSGLKSFICSGDCNPPAGTAPTAELNYTGFINWDVTAGRVDLVGLLKWNVLPGPPDHGLYVDMQGTGGGEDFGLGQITSKADYDFEDGKEYRFSLDVGGSVQDAGTWTIRVRAGDSLDELITITQLDGDAVTPFAPHVFEWTQAGDFTGPIIIEQTAQSGHHNVGTCIDNILLENVTDVSVMLEDDFNSENPKTIPPSTSYYGCLETPPGAQTADPTPPTPRIVE